MRRNAFGAFLAVSVLFIIQNAFGFLFSSGFGVPPLFLIGVIFYSLLEGPVFGALFGLTAGIYLEIFSIGPIGYEMAILALLGTLAGFAASKIFRDSFLIQFFLPAASFYLFTLWNVACSKIILGEPVGVDVLGSAFCATDLLTTMLVSPLVFMSLRKISSRRQPRSLRWL